MPSEPISAEDRVRNEVRDNGAPASFVISRRAAIRVAEEHAAAAVASVTRQRDDARLLYDTIFAYSVEYRSRTEDSIKLAHSLQTQLDEARAGISLLTHQRDEAKRQLATCCAHLDEVHGRLCAAQGPHRKTDERLDVEHRFFDTVPNRGGKTMQNEPMIDEIKRLKAEIDEARATVRSLIAERDAALAEVARLKEVGRG